MKSFNNVLDALAFLPEDISIGFLISPNECWTRICDSGEPATSRWGECSDAKIQQVACMVDAVPCIAMVCLGGRS